MLRRFLNLAGITIALTTLQSAVFGQISVGMKVFPAVATPLSTPVKEGNRTICTISDLDWPCVVEKVNDDWLWLGDTTFHGWVQKKAVVTIDDAIRERSEALQQNPSAAKYNNRGAAWAAKGEYELAIKDHSEAIRLEPQDGLYYFNRGKNWLAKVDARTAINDLTQAIRLLVQDPVQYDAYRHRSIAYEMIGDYDAAKSDSREAERIKRSLAR